MLRTRLPMLLLLSVQSMALAFGYYDSINNGSRVPGLSPLSVALGSPRAIVHGEPSCIFTNPAAAAGLALSFQGSLAGVSWTERVIENAYEQQLRTLNGTDYFSGAVSYPAGKFTLSAGYAKVAEFGYEGTHEEYAGDELQAVSVLYSDGGQTEGLIGVSTRMTGSLSAGVSAGFRHSSADYSYYFNSHDEEIPDSSAQWDLDHTGLAWHAGLMAEDGLFRSAVSYSSETEYMDAVLALGFSAFAPHLNDITVSFEGELEDPFDTNWFIGRLAVEMPLRSNLSALTSVSFDDHKVASTAGLGFGIGIQWVLGEIELDGGMYSGFRARRNTAFPDEESERVDDGAAIFRFGIGYTPGNA